MSEVLAHKFGTGDPQPPVMLSGIDRLGEKLGRRLRALFEPLVGSRGVVGIENARAVTYGDWAADVPQLVSISLYRMPPFKGPVAVRLNPDMVAAVLDCFYGGTGLRPAPKRNEFTPTEERLIAKLSDSIIENMVDAWSDLVAIDAAFTAREANLAYAAIAPDEEVMLLQRFTLSLGGNQSWPIDILTSVASMRGVEVLFETRPHDEGRIVDATWQGGLGARVAQVSLPVRTVLARPNLTLAELMQLQEGDVIPVHIGRNLPLIVGNRVIAHGTVGEQNGRAAFMIEKIAQGSH